MITVHDGFTLRDLVSDDGKHNEANLESNRDGTDDNRSWNCGAEGVSEDPDVLALRARQSRDADHPAASLHKKGRGLPQGTSRVQTATLPTGHRTDLR